MGPPYLEVAEIPTKLAAKGEVVKAPLVVEDMASEVCQHGQSPLYHLWRGRRGGKIFMMIRAPFCFTCTEFFALDRSIESKVEMLSTWQIWHTLAHLHGVLFRD
jgi:hypothetical protein